MTAPIPASLRALLSGLIDYAGLFPPARLPMEQAIEEYAERRSGEHAWMLGRFVVPAARLEEFACSVGNLFPPAGAASPARGTAWPAEPASAGRDSRPAGPWPLTVLVGADISSDLRAMESFAGRAIRAAIDALEARAATAAEVDAICSAAGTDRDLYIEIPAAEDPGTLVRAIARRRARAKVRTGGVTVEAFPSSSHLARFMAACLANGVPFKATAGLHHPVTGTYRLTYEPDSASARMFGFLNLFLAAAAGGIGLAGEQVIALLDDFSPSAFRFDDAGAWWRDVRIPVAAIEAARGSAALSFGSCSFGEPVSDLVRLGLLPAAATVADGRA